MKIVAKAVSHPGCCRDKNEDTFCFFGRTLKKNSGWMGRRVKTDTPQLLGVFDGMGGMSAGERASAVTARIACDAELRQGEDIPAQMVAICQRANDQVCREMREVTHTRMGTTAAMLCFAEGRYHLCNIGDSPVFLCRDGTLHPIHREHTEKENYLLVHGAETQLPNKKFKLTQHIGIFPQEMEIEPYTQTADCQPGDRFLIASDGLTDMVDQADIATVLERHSVAAATRKLLRQALNNGGKDNVTILCIEVR